MVAWDHVKTPTALADLFIERTAAADEKISSFENRLQLAFRSRLAALESALALSEKTIISEVKARLSAAEAAVALLEAKIAATDPRNVLKRGFSLVLDGRGVRMGGVKGRKPGDTVSVLFADGRMVAEVKEVKTQENG